MNAIRKIKSAEYLKSKKLILLGFLIYGSVLIVLGATIFLHYHDQNQEYKNFTIANQTATSMSLVWQSEKPYEGKVYYKEGSSLSQMFSVLSAEVAYDDRNLELDEAGEYVLLPEADRKMRHTHHVTLRNLKPQTTYSFLLGGNVSGTKFDVPNSVTLAVEEDLATPDPAYGEVLSLDEDNDTVVILTGRDIPSRVRGRLSAPVSENGSYSFDLSYFQFQEIDGRNLSLRLFSGKDDPKEYTFDTILYKPLPAIEYSNED
ncbi:MAG: fibronectin type III domain-containing protein [Candidatus Dojkabacteria bacterium]